MDSTVLKTLTRSIYPKLKNESDLLKANPSTYTASFSGVNKVYNLFPGTVLFLGYYKGRGTVSVEVSPYEIIRYCNLSDIQVWYNTEVSNGSFLGTIDDKVDLQLEYCTLGPVTSSFPIRINDKTYYKQNPIEILEGNWVPEQSTTITQALSFADDLVQLSAEQVMEWGLPNGRNVNPDLTIDVTNLKDIPEAAIYMLTDNKGDD